MGMFLDSLVDLDDQLKAINLQLVIFKGTPSTVI